MAEALRGTLGTPRGGHHPGAPGDVRLGDLQPQPPGTPGDEEVKDITVKINQPAGAHLVGLKLTGGSNLGTSTRSVVSAGGRLTPRVGGPFYGGTTFELPVIEAVYTAPASGTLVTSAAGTGFDDTGLSMKRLDTTLDEFTPVQCYPDPAARSSFPAPPCSDLAPPTGPVRVTQGGRKPLPPGVESFSTVPGQGGARSRHRPEGFRPVPGHRLTSSALEVLRSSCGPPYGAVYCKAVATNGS
ncbi:hypothetical protein [Streptomyces sp. NPDC088757]|uniref:hypothetical protein n=1 Tax=Streptomyces sp. NPDC088757 TaxID=3365889 RepID=UPI0037F50CD3